MAFPSDGILEIPPDDEPQPQGEDMPIVDMPEDRATLAMAESFDSFQSLTHEAEANAQSVDNIINHSAARKFDGEDPLEAMAHRKILDA